MTIRVLVADDHAAIRLGLVMILSGVEGIEVVGEAGDGATAVRLARALRLDVVLMDVRMSGTDGIEATREVIAARQKSCGTRLTLDVSPAHPVSRGPI